ncbi:hypothetical protein L3X38_032200 [Prunus dulcis]|uniref:Uncharacterized protein n=1 Tax=Prunus dulcis TaxID=3755 RepID=A0AAD4VEP0_PRUDU|nr:hypothetical protein L3X38_032200 [Prunus dulcis]
MWKRSLSPRREPNPTPPPGATVTATAVFPPPQATIRAGTGPKITGQPPPSYATPSPMLAASDVAGKSRNPADFDPFFLRSFQTFPATKSCNPGISPNRPVRAKLAGQVF